MQAQAEQEPGLQAGEGWFDVCSEGSQSSTGSRRSPSQRHSEYTASLGEAVYSAAAHALSFLCAVAPEVCPPRNQVHVGVVQIWGKALPGLTEVGGPMSIIAVLLWRVRMTEGIAVHVQGLPIHCACRF